MSKKFYDRILKSSSTSSKAVKSDYAGKLMSKMGWKEGDGLGRNKEGMLDPLQFKIREENLGLGEEEKNPSQDWNSWWVDSYNSVASAAVAAQQSDSDSSSDDELIMGRAAGKSSKKSYILESRKRSRPGEEAALPIGLDLLGASRSDRKKAPPN